LFAVRGYFVVLLYLQVALLLAGTGIATFPWGVLTVGTQEFVDQGIIFVLAIPGVLGLYIVNTRRRLEKDKPAD
jgi:hypothetical protein